MQLSHHAAQEFPLEKLHREKINVAVTVQLIYVDDVFVGESLSAMELAPEVCDQITAIVRVRVQYFYRNISIFLGKIRAVPIQCFEHRALAAYPQALFQNIAIAYDAADPNWR